MTPPTQSDARWEPPEWLVEKAYEASAHWTRDVAGPTDKGQLEAVIDTLLSECPVLGLTREEVEAALRGGHALQCPEAQPRTYCNCGWQSFRSKLLAARAALGEGPS